MSRIVLTGGAGFIGSHLADALIAAGNEVIVLDSLVSGRRENLAAAAASDRLTFHEHDVTEYIKIPGAVDAVIHLAGLASPDFYQHHPIKTLKVGALGTHNTLGLAKAKNATYLFASTSEVYGDPEVNPQPETYRGHVDPYGPRACYDESKRYGEALVRAYRDKHDIDVRVARIFNTYGPRMRLDDGRVIPNFMRQALTGDDVTVYGDGSQTRSFCYISDLVSGLCQLLETDVETPINLGNPDERTIQALAELVIERTESDSDITHEPLPPQDPQVRCPDISKAQDRLDWEPTVGLKDGLDNSIDYFEPRI